VVRDGRSKFTAAERERVEELMAEFQKRLIRIGRMIDGKQ
jgi:hypothetical protein